MMVRRLADADRDAAARLLAQAFVDDAGMLAVVGRTDRLEDWFRVTLELFAPPYGLVLGADEGGELRGVLVRGSTTGAGSVRQLAWLVQAVIAVGARAVWRTIEHDRHRAASFQASGAHVVEFVAVDPAFRGGGVGRSLFEASHADGGIHWLETTRAVNLPIFARLGYQLTSKRTELGVTYHVMQRPEDLP
jgi:ribosomal protein S18 acetylase RimI-like enzyme